MVKHILQSYESVGVHGRPVENVSEATVKVSVGLYLVQIHNFDQGKQVITLTGIVKMVSQISNTSLLLFSSDNGI